MQSSQHGLSIRALDVLGKNAQAAAYRSLLRRVSLRRQEEITEIMALSGDRCLSFLRLLVLASNGHDFVRSKKVPRGVRSSEIKLIEREIGFLEDAFRASAATYADDAYALALTESYFRSLLKNPRIAVYLRTVRPKLFAEMRPLLSSDA
jgi:hypothetical protein